MNQQSAPLKEDDQQWRALLAQCQLLNAAAVVAWNALIDAYRPLPNGNVQPSADLLLRYKNASSLRVAAEKAMLHFIETGEPVFPLPAETPRT